MAALALLVATAAHASSASSLPEAAGRSADYELDAEHSKIVFSVRHFTIATVEGTFVDIDVSARIDEDELERSSVEVAIDAETIDTGNGERDEHLRSDDFFAVDRYPEILFHSTSITRTAEDRFEVRGVLTLRGVQREVLVPVRLAGPITDPMGARRLGVEGELTLDRRDYGLSWNRVLEGGGLFVSNDVHLRLSLELRERDSEETTEPHPPP